MTAKAKVSLPWILILGLTATFHFFRGVPVDGWIFLTVAVVLALDAFGVFELAKLPAPGFPAMGRLASGVGVVWVVLLVLPGGGLGMSAVVGLVGLAMVALAWPDPPSFKPVTFRGGGPRLRLAAVLWSCVLLFLCVWELGTYFIDRFSPASETNYPALSDLLQPLFAADTSRWLMTALWLVACTALLRQSRRA